MKNGAAIAIFAWGCVQCPPPNRRVNKYEYFALSGPHGVFENKDILDLAEDGARVLKILQGSFTESIIKIQLQEACQDSNYPPSLFLES